VTIPYRGQTSASTYFVTAGVWSKRNLLQSERMAKLFCHVLLEYHAKEKFLLHAFVVMPNHVHLLITVPAASTLERTMRLIKGGFSREAGKLLNLAHPFWQKSFVDRRVRDAGEFARFREYIHQNPVAANLCNSQDRYPYSSANQGRVTDAAPQRLKPVSENSSAVYR
jgi:putative transposase